MTVTLFYLHILFTRAFHIHISQYTYSSENVKKKRWRASCAVDNLYSIDIYTSYKLKLMILKSFIMTILVISYIFY